MIPTLSSAQYIDDFLSGIIKDAGMDNVSPDVKGQMLKDLRARLEDRLFGAVVMNLSDDDLTAFRKLTDKGASQEEVERFIDSRIPDAKEVFAQAMLAFRNDYLGIS